MNPSYVPVLPESAPFTPEQRAYLNGFLAGLFSHAPIGVPSAPTKPVSVGLQSLSILFGSQTGNCESLAKRLAKEGSKQGFATTIHDLGKYSVVQLAGEQNVLILVSTYGDGAPPDNAKAFWDALQAPGVPQMGAVRFSVCAMGDTNYPKFCAFGKEVDRRLEQLGAQRIHPRTDCDVEYEVPFSTWMAGALRAFAAKTDANAPPTPAPDAASLPAHPDPAIQEAYSKKRPFPARLVTNRRLNGAGSEKDVRHFEIALGTSGLTYEVGDALGVLPQNDPVLVAEILAVLGASGTESVTIKDGLTGTLRGVLTQNLEITKAPKALLGTLAQKSGDAELIRLLTLEASADLTQFLYGRELIDFLSSYPAVKFAPQEFVDFLRKLQPRLYSISSSPKAHPGEVHLTVASVRYESHGRKRNGVCSTFLADRVGTETQVPIFVHANKAFRPPPGDRPLIMVGPGTGIAPFRAFLEERQATGAKGRNWLFFGDQKSSTDFLYQNELEVYFRDGLLTRLDVAWSRDQARKVYVQDKMRLHAGELYRWLEDGAGFYVCGDASRMAKDVDVALQELIQSAGAKTPEQAIDYVKQLKANQRYLRDVY